jgi:hypothetical protein
MIRKLFFISCLLLIISCESDDNDGKEQCLGEPKVMACPDNLLPVCGCDGETYGNACYAEASGVLSWTDGECQ